MIDSRSVAYWSKCLYEARGFFEGDQTAEAVNASQKHLRDYAEAAHLRRSQSPYGDVYYAELDSILQPSTRVLEFGCGAGIDSWYMASKGADVVACDVVPANILVARRLLEPDMGTVLLLSSYHQLRELGTFDLVYSHGCLHHLDPASLRLALPLLKACLVPRGTMLVMVYTEAFYPVENFHPEGPYTRGYSTESLSRVIGPGLRWISSRTFMNGCFAWHQYQKE